MRTAALATHGSSAVSSSPALVSPLLESALAIGLACACSTHAEDSPTARDSTASVGVALPDIEGQTPSPAVDGRLVWRVEDPYHRLPDLELDLTASPVGQRDTGQHPVPLHARTEVGRREFVFDALPAGRWRVVLQDPDLGELTSDVLQVQSGRTTEHLYRWRRQDLTRAIWVRLAPDQGMPWITWGSADRPHPTLARLSIDGRPVRVARYFNDALLFEDLEAGSYDLDLEDTRFQPVHLAGLHPGEGRSTSVAGSAGIRVDVRAGVDQVVVTDYRAWLISSDSEGFHEPFWPLLLEGGSPPPEGLYPGVVPIWSEIVIAARGRGRVRLPLDGLAPGATFEVQATLGATCRIEARVLDARGAGVSGVEVAVQQPSEEAVYYAWCHVMGPSGEDWVGTDPELELDIIPLWALASCSTKLETPGVTLRVLSSNAEGFVIGDGFLPGAVTLRPRADGGSYEQRLVQVVPEGVSGIELVLE